MVDLDADLESIFEGDDLDQVDALFTVAGPAEFTTRGFFTAASDAVTINETRIEAMEPTFMARTSEITAVRKGDSVVISAVTYSVERIQKLGDGMSVCYLKT